MDGDAICKGYSEGQTHLPQELLEPIIPQRGSIKPTATHGQTSNPTSQALPVRIQDPLHRRGAVTDPHDLHHRVRGDESRVPQDLLEDAPDVRGGAAVARHRVGGGAALRAVVAEPAPVHGAAHRGALRASRGEAAASLGPPPQLARVGEDDSGGGIFGAGGATCVVFIPILMLVLIVIVLEERPGNVYHAALVDSAGATDDPVRDDAELLLALADDEDDALLALEVGRDEDGDVGLGCRGVQGQGELGQAQGLEARVDELCLDGSVEGETLAVVVSHVLGVEVVEVVGRPVDPADLVRLGLDEVAEALVNIRSRCSNTICLASSECHAKWFSTMGRVVEGGGTRERSLNLPKLLQVGRKERVLWQTRPASPKHFGFFVEQVSP